MPDSQELFFRLEPIDPAHKLVSESVLDDEDESITVMLYPGVEKGTYLHHRDHSDDTAKRIDALSPEDAVERLRREVAADGFRLVEISQE